MIFAVTYNFFVYMKSILPYWKNTFKVGYKTDSCCTNEEDESCFIWNITNSTSFQNLTSGNASINCSFMLTDIVKYNIHFYVDAHCNIHIVLSLHCKFTMQNKKHNKLYIYFNHSRLFGKNTKDIDAIFFPIHGLDNIAMYWYANF
jgi:hypothetical protein